MAAVGMGSGDIQKYLEPGVVAACENSERSTTLAGDADVVERVVSRIKEAQPSIQARFLQVDEAYHSHHIVAVKDEVSAKKLFSSTVTGRQLTSDCEVGAEYWQRKLGSRVLFHSAVSSIIQHEIANNMVFLEIGVSLRACGPFAINPIPAFLMCQHLSAIKLMSNHT